VLVGYVLSATPKIVVPAIVIGETTSSVHLQVFADLGNEEQRDAVHKLVADGRLSLYNSVLVARSVTRGPWAGFYTGVNEVAPNFLDGFAPKDDGSTTSSPAVSGGGIVSDGILANASIAAQAQEAAPIVEVPPAAVATPAAESAPDLVGGDPFTTVHVEDTDLGSNVIPGSTRDVLRPEQLDGHTPEVPPEGDPLAAG
jgi:hypothetical protein